LSGLKYEGYELYKACSRGSTELIRRCFFVVLVLIIFNASIAAGQPEETSFLPVLVYHHIQDPVKSDVSCTPEQFDLQIAALIQAGYTPITLSQARLFLAGALRNIDKPVLITFDDGYESLYFHAKPVAEKYRAPMTVFVITARIGRRLQFANYLNERQIKEMTDCGFFDFGSHTHDLHTDSVAIFDAFEPTDENPVLLLLQRDLRMSSQRFEIITGRRPEAIAWPYGKYNAAFSAIARKSGFKMHFTSASGYNEPGANPFAIKRIPVTSRDTPESVLKKASGRYR